MLGLLSILIAFFSVQDNSLDVQLKKYLDIKLAGYDKYEYQVVQTPQNYSRIEINNEKKSRLTKNYLYVPVKIYDSKNLTSNSILTLRVKLYKKVLAASDEIRRNENLDREKLDIKLEEISLYGGNLPGTDIDPAKFRSRTLIKAGSVITTDMLEPIPLIYKGDKITLHTGNTGVEISIEVIARQDGCAGDVISVYTGGNKLYKGRIVDKNTITLVE